MIIDCNNCHKKFDIDSNLIPDNGRLLQCNSCDHKWFYKKEIINDPIKPINIEKEETINLLDNTTKIEADINDSTHEKESKIVEEIKLKDEPLIKPKKQRHFRILNLLVISIISLTAFIIILDTFKSPIGKIVPNTELLLYNLYETFNDVFLFIRDLF